MSESETAVPSLDTAGPTPSDTAPPNVDSAAGIPDPDAPSPDTGAPSPDTAADPSDESVAKYWTEHNVTLHRQGDINFVINAEPGGFGQQFARVHGPSACAMAFRVKDAVRALERAVGLGARPVETSIGPMELRIPAIEGIGPNALQFSRERLERRQRPFGEEVSRRERNHQHQRDTEEKNPGEGLQL